MICMKQPCDKFSCTILSLEKRSLEDLENNVLKHYFLIVYDKISETVKHKSIFKSLKQSHPLHIHCNYLSSNTNI